MITEFYENESMTLRAMRKARLSWGNEIKSTRESDLVLMEKLVKSGDSHSASLRQAVVYFDLVATRGFWQQFSKYRVGVEMYSESTMHTLRKRTLERCDFSHNTTQDAINAVNVLISGSACIETIKSNLPEGFLQKRAIMASYQALRTMYIDRKNHKLGEWSIFLSEILQELAFPTLIRSDI